MPNYRKWTFSFFKFQRITNNWVEEQNIRKKFWVDKSEIFDFLKFLDGKFRTNV